MPFFKNKSFWYKFLIVAIIASGIFIRFWQLNNIPPGIHYDEAFNGINAISANENHSWKIFYEDNTGREGFHINVEALFIKIFGNNNFGLRFANALWGSLTIIGFFLLLRELKFSRFSQALGTFMLSFSFWHLVFSRTAYRAIMIPLVLVWMFYFLAKGIKTKNKKKFLYFALSGALLGLGFHTYIAFRIAPLIFVILAIFMVLTSQNFLRKYWKIALVIVLAMVIIALPMFLFYAGHYKDFIGRTMAVSIISSQKITPLQAFGRSLGSHLNAFFVHGDNNARHNYNSQPLLPAAWSVLFAIGLVISFREIIITTKKFIKYRLGGNKNVPQVSRWFYVSVLSQSIFWVMLIPGVLSIEGIPHSLRIIGTIPAVFILMVLPIEYLIRIYKSFIDFSEKDKFRSKNTFLTVAAGFLILIVFGGIFQAYEYFYIWPNDLRTQGAYERKLYFLGNLVRQLPTHDNNYIITAYNTFITSDRKQSSLKTVEFLAYPDIKKYSFYKPIDGIGAISCDDPQIVFQESDQWLRDQYRNRCPGLNTKRFDFDGKKYTFFVVSGDK